jgi:uncharacterized protein YacL
MNIIENIRNKVKKINDDKLFKHLIELLIIKIIFFSFLLFIEYLTYNISISLPQTIETPLITILFFGITSVYFGIFIGYAIKELRDPIDEKINNKIISLIISISIAYLLFYLSQRKIENILNSIFGNVVKKTIPYRLLGYIIGHPLVIFSLILLGYIINEIINILRSTEKALGYGIHSINELVLSPKN